MRPRLEVFQIKTGQALGGDDNDILFAENVELLDEELSQLSITVENVPHLLCMQGYFARLVITGSKIKL